MPAPAHAAQRRNGVPSLRIRRHWPAHVPAQRRLGARSGRRLAQAVAEADAAALDVKLKKMCEGLLANTVIETFRWELAE